MLLHQSQPCSVVQKCCSKMSMLGLVVRCSLFGRCSKTLFKVLSLGGGGGGGGSGGELGGCDAHVIGSLRHRV
jgi:hypothetical protein